MQDQSSVARLYGVIQSYDWGVKGSESLVAASHSANCRQAGTQFKAEEEKPYAELWFGTHPNGCSTVIPIVPDSGDTPVTNKPVDTPIALKDYLDDPETSNRGECPYLFKILSIAKPLSLQLHPDEESARVLHTKKPDIYKDPRDKPEMAMAVSNPFEAFCGFRKLKEIVTLGEVVPAFGQLLRNAVGQIDDPGDEEKTLRALLNNLYGLPQSRIQELMDEIIGSQLYESLVDEPDNEGMLSQAVKLVLSWFGQDQSTTNMAVKAYHLFKRLHEAFPYDRGCFAPFFLNYVKLKPGECIFLAPNTIHAYIKGNCLECMKCSDNVVRAGLTPKYQDVETLKKLVDCRALSVSSAVVKPHDVSCKVIQSGVMSNGKSSLRVYIPPITDAFRYYVLRLPTASKAPDVPIPQWYPVIIHTIYGRVKVRQTSATKPGYSTSVTLSAGSSLVVKEFQTLGIDNPSKDWNGEKLHYADMLTIDPKALDEGSNTEGAAVILFVLPNIEASKVKRTASSGKSTPTCPQEDSDSSNQAKTNSVTEAKAETQPTAQSPDSEPIEEPKAPATQQVPMQSEPPANDPVIEQPSGASSSPPPPEKPVAEQATSARPASLVDKVVTDEPVVTGNVVTDTQNK